MKYTKEMFERDLVSLSGIQLHKGVLTTKEQNDLIKSGKKVMYEYTATTANKRAFFFSDVTSFSVLPDEFVTCSVAAGCAVVPRESLPDGIIKNADDYIAIFQRDSIQINSMDELVDYLNENISEFK